MKEESLIEDEAVCVYCSLPIDHCYCRLFRGENILITGGGGSIGSALAESILTYGPKSIRVLDNNENGIYALWHKLRDRTEMRYLLGDIRDTSRLEKAMEGIGIVYHAAALKQVPLCEFNPFEAILTNVTGTQNVIDASIQNDVGKLIFISTDKAVNPVGTMGTTKQLAESLITTANYHKGAHKTILSFIRLGNILGSRGSVLPVLDKQIKEGQPLTITDPNMTRFIMTMGQAISVIFKATELSRGSEFFVAKMRSVNVRTLVTAIIKKAGLKQPISKEYIGLRVGEKLHEALMTEDEGECALETKELFIIQPRFPLPVGEMQKYNYPNASRVTIRNYTSMVGALLTESEVLEMLNDV